ncbi:gag-protease polyprotein [Trifolium repens]|nr:gag-protease polyprotein [Trifolium repens]
MSKSAKFISEGGSSNRPPLFEGDDYYYWKDKMELFLRSQDNNMWSVIEIGEYVPLVKDSTTPKTPGEWSTQEADRVLLNTKAKLFIKSAMSREEYDRIMQCKTAKEMWETLQVHHEGTSRVKETRIDIGVRKFELFEMQEDESIDQMYGRFTIIINELNSLGKTYTTHEKIRKLLRCLTKNWRHIVTAITESKDLSQMKLEDLIGSLKAHESILQEDKPVKKKMIALDSQTREHSQIVEDNLENEDEDEDEEMAFLSRKIQRLMQRRNQLKRSFQPKRSGSKEVDMSKIKCYGCDQFGHYKNECPKQRKPSFKKKSMMATWDETDEESEEEHEEQTANVCLMTHSVTEEVSTEPCSSCQKTEHLFDNLLYDTQLLNQKNGKLRDEVTKANEERDKYKAENIILHQMLDNMQNSHKDMSKQIDEIRKEKNPLECSKLKEENVFLKNRVSVLENDLRKFITSTKTFDKILGSQFGVFDKAGIGYRPYQNKKLYENFFLPKKQKKNQKYKCTFCLKEGHLETFCFKKKERKQPLSQHREHSQNDPRKRIYKPPHRRTSHQVVKRPAKTVFTNPQGPRNLWVPKVLLKSNVGMSSSSQEKAMVLGQWLLKTYDKR